MVVTGGSGVTHTTFIVLPTKETRANPDVSETLPTWSLRDRELDSR